MAQVVFKVNGKTHQVDGKFGPDYTLNEYVRVQMDLRGTKTMCFEGGCGACIVSVKASLPPTYEMRTFAVNSGKPYVVVEAPFYKYCFWWDFRSFCKVVLCLVSLLSCHGWEVTTIKGIGNQKKGYHVIQKRLAMFHGSQCGFCSPGFVLNMYSLYETRNQHVSSVEVENSFGSNLCRCTGYRPILDAFKSLAYDADKKLYEDLYDVEDLGKIKCKSLCFKQCGNNHCQENSNITETNKIVTNEEDVDSSWCLIQKDDSNMFVVDCGKYKWYKVFTLDDLFDCIKKREYKLLAGNTGQGVYHIGDYPPNVIDISSISELKGYVIDINLVLGAAMTLTELLEVFDKVSVQNEEFAYLKELKDHLDLVAHVAVRNIGTIAGNLFLKHTNKEFSSDLFVMFCAVGAMITIAEDASKNKTMFMDEFFKYDMMNKVIKNVLLPPLSHCCLVKTYKVMPRAQNAHAVVNAGFLFKFHRNSPLLESVNIVYGGIARNFVHATKTEGILVGQDPFINETLQNALKSLHDEIKPEEFSGETSAAYRKMLAVSLFYKAILYLCPSDKVNKEYKSGGNISKRVLSKGLQVFDSDKTVWPLNQPVQKVDALVQCAGEALFSNDINTYVNDLFAAFVTTDAVPGSVIGDFDTTEAMKLPGVLSFYTVKDIPGDNNFTPKKAGMMSDEEEILCSGKVRYFGQPAGIIVAKRQNIATLAAKLVKITYSSTSTNKPLLTIDDVLKSEQKERIVNDKTVTPTELGKDVAHVLKGEFKMKGQYHFHMEPQTCTVSLSEDGLEVYSASQWIDLVHIAVAQCLKLPMNKIKVIVSRVGGGYGAKISRPPQVACAAALVTFLMRKTCRFILPLETNMKSIGKRLPTNCNFEVGVNKEGVIQYLKNTFYQDCGYSFNEIITPLTSEFFKSFYESKKWKIVANSVATDTASNTWCRSPGSAEGIAMIENIMEFISFKTKKDPIQIRMANLANDSPIPKMIQQLNHDSQYETRMQQIIDYNKQNRWRKKALKILPMKFDITYFGSFNAIVSIYHGDFTITVIHGGIEMGQGINTKVAQVAAHILGVPFDKVAVNIRATSYTSPNAMITGGSIGSECTVFATVKACEILLERLLPYKQKGNSTWEEVITKAHKDGVDLQASYMYSAQKDNVKPYGIYAVCALELELDILTGNHEILRVDILEDAGRSLSPKIDVGQIEGAFVMGLGYWTSENLIYEESTGKLLTDRTWTYKPPGIKDIPADMRIYLSRNTPNQYGVLQSKATGEPAFCLATVVIHALREAVRVARLDMGYNDDWIQIENPCTVENIFNSVGHKIEHFLLN